MTEQFGPEYNVASPVLAKHRQLARDGLAAMTWEQRQAYGSAVEAAVLAAQRREAMRACVPGKRCGCASGTWYSDGADISAAIREQHRRALAACGSQERRARTPAEWETMYEAAMEAKAAAIAASLLAGGSMFEEAA
jgi:hypothetical protein